MNNKLSALLTTAIVTGLLATTAAKAEEAGAAKGNADEMAAGANGCNGKMKSEDKKEGAAMGKEHKCGGKKKMKKNACGGKGGCKGEAKEEQKDK